MSKVSNLSLSDVFFQVLNAPKLVFDLGSAQRSPNGPNSLVGWGGDTRSYLDAFDVSIY